MRATRFGTWVGLLAAAAVTLTALAVSSGCGMRSSPRPPEDTAIVLETPKAVRNADGSIAIEWKRPEQSADGKRVRDLAGFVVERGTVEEGFTELAIVPVIDNEKIRPQRKFSYTDEDPPATTVSYRIRAFDDYGQRGLPASTGFSDAPDDE